MCEKETKTKPYSKEGIGQQKHDNAGVEEARSWLGMLCIMIWLY